jgi:hypothetical protein
VEVDWREVEVDCLEVGGGLAGGGLAEGGEGV